MPEGDTIFRAARALHRALAGKLVTRFHSVFPRLNRIDEDQPIAGRTVEKVEARGKHLLIWFSGGLALRTHMRMSGSWHLYRPGEAWQRATSDLRIAVESADFLALAFHVHEAEWLDERTLARSAVAKLGPDVLANQFDRAVAADNLREARGRPICDALLNQRVLAGLGNVYKSELLFLTGLHPLRSAETITRVQAAKLVELAQKLMASNVGPAADGGMVTYRGLRRTTGRADPGERLWVYGRAGAPCRKCGGAISSALLGKDVRRTYWCPNCQPDSQIDRPDTTIGR
ncbi:MAG TPA: DNA-formamidopyrimidine glycosylase family protein [Polyangiales bacterium]|jgi:endonuclease-8